MSWESFRLEYRGHLGEVLQYGGGKISTTGGDPGEPRKPIGIEGKSQSLPSGDGPGTFTPGFGHGQGNGPK